MKPKRCRAWSGSSVQTPAWAASHDGAKAAQNGPSPQEQVRQRTVEQVACGDSFKFLPALCSASA